MADDIYAFSDEGDFDRNIQSIRITEGRTISNGVINGTDGFPLFAKITSIVDGTNSRQAKGLQVILDASIGDYAEDGWLFDVDDTAGDASARQGDIYSGHDMAVNDVVQVFRYKDKSDTSDWIGLPIGGGGGSERPIIKTSGALAFGATLESIISQTVKTEFTEAQSFLGYYPWGLTAILPDDYVFTADVDSTGAFYTEVFPSTMYVKPLESYPADTGFDDFQIYESATTSSNLLYDSTINIIKFKLLLSGFDFANASQAEKDYYDSTDLLFPVTFSVSDQAFYFISPLVGD